MSNTPISVEVMVGDKKIIIETGLYAQQAHGAATVRQGDTIILSAVTASSAPREGIDYFPLQVEYREKFYAAGRFPGGFFKREGRPAEKEILTARFTDRPIRPLFATWYRNDVQIYNSLLSADGINDCDVIGVLAASAALTLSELPFFGPIGAVRVARIDGKFVFNPTNAEMLKSDLDLVYAGNREEPVMIEGGATEISEADLIKAMKAAHAEVVKMVDAQLELRRKTGLPKKVVEDKPADHTLVHEARRYAEADMLAAMEITNKQARQSRVGAIADAVKAKLVAAHPSLTKEEFRATFDELEILLVREQVLKRNHRIGGRGLYELRPLQGLVGVLPRVHGSSFFGRGETQSLATITLGAAADTQDMDGITGGPTSKSFYLHYNFPPYSVGETGRVGTPGRREIGHGALAERSLVEVMPKDYPYTVRVASDIMSSNGSTSMASVCAGTLALMDAGVPIRKPVAGISCGLFTDASHHQVVVDILGVEDHCGDMDFKVAGTRDGITGFQVDLKIRGLPWNIVEEAFTRAQQARMQILDFMATVIAAPRADLSPYSPRIHTMSIPVDKIGGLIGPGGSNIRRITSSTGAQIDIEDDGTVRIFAAGKEAMEAAVNEVGMVTAEAEEGKLYHGTVTGVKEFGAFVEILPGRDGLCHISELSDRRIGSVEEVCKVGDKMWVKCVGIDDRGRVKLSRKQAMAERDGKADG